MARQLVHSELMHQCSKQAINSVNGDSEQSMESRNQIGDNSIHTSKDGDNNSVDSHTSQHSMDSCDNGSGHNLDSADGSDDSSVDSSVDSQLKSNLDRTDSFISADSILPSVQALSTADDGTANLDGETDGDISEDEPSVISTDESSHNSNTHTLGLQQSVQSILNTSAERVFIPSEKKILWNQMSHLFGFKRSVKNTESSNRVTMSNLSDRNGDIPSVEKRNVAISRHKLLHLILQQPVLNADHVSGKQVCNISGKLLLIYVWVQYQEKTMCL